MVIPGMFRCPRCGYTLGRFKFYTGDGSIGMNVEKKREVCPNDGTDLVPQTTEDDPRWKEERPS